MLDNKKNYIEEIGFLKPTNQINFHLILLMKNQKMEHIEVYD